MFRKFTAAAMPAMIVALIVLSTCDSASLAMARGRGGGGGHRGGGGHVRRSSSRQNHVSHHRTFSQNAHQKHSFAQNKHKHSQHHHRRHRGYFGWNDGDYGDGDFADGDVDPSDGDAVAAVLPITLLNPSEIGRPVSYTLDAGDYSVDPAGSKVHNEGTQVIVFDRGGAFGQATYTLQPGTYRFAMTDKGLDLRTVTPQVATNQGATNQVAADTVANPE